MPDWSETTLDSCVALTKGVTYAAVDYADKGQGHPFLTIKSVKKGGGFNEEGLKYYKGPYKPAQAVKPGDLLVALTDLTRAGDIIGGPFRVPELGAPVVLPSMDLAVLRAGDEPIDFSFLAYRLMLHDARRYMLARSAGTTVLHLDSKAALKFSFLRPKPEAQKRITEILSTVDEAIEQTDALIAKTQQIKAGLMHELFTRGVTPDGQLRPPREEAPQLYKESPLGWIPKEWEPKTAAACAADSPGSTTIGPFGSNLVAADYRSEGIPVVFVRDIKEEGFRWNSDVYVTSEKAYELSSHSVRSGDIVATKMGFPPCIACSYPDWMPPGVITADIIRLRPNATTIDIRWLSAALNCDAVKRQVQAITAGVTRPKVTLADFRTILVACPGYDEQQMIGDRLDAINVVLAAERSRVNKLTKQKYGLMHDLLNGRVEVFQ